MFFRAGARVCGAKAKGEPRESIICQRINKCKGLKRAGEKIREGLELNLLRPRSAFPPPVARISLALTFQEGVGEGKLSPTPRISAYLRANRCCAGKSFIRVGAVGIRNRGET